MEVVSKRIVMYSLVISSFFLIIRGSFDYLHPNYVYICNENNILDIYKIEHNKNSVINPQNLKNILHCLGKGMPFYQRSLYTIEGYVPYSLKTDLSKRYSIQFLQRNNRKNNTYCLKSDNTYLILQKKINSKELRQSLSKCKPSIIVTSVNYRENDIFKALLSQGYSILFVEAGESIKIYL